MLENKQYNTIYTLFCEQQLPPIELVIFYKIHFKSTHAYNADYWQSALPLLHTESIINSDLRATWISAYLEKAEHCNPSLNRELLRLCPGEFIRFIKYSKAFEYGTFFTSLSELSSEYAFLETTVKELSLIKRKLSSLRSDERRENTELLHLPLPNVLAAISLYYHGYKQSDVNAGNKALQTEIEMALVNDVDRIITLFFYHNRQAIPFFETPDDLKEHFENYCAPHHVLGKDRPQFKHPALSHVYELIENSIRRRSLRGRIDLYCCGYADFTDLEKEPSRLKTTPSFTSFEFNNKKSQAEELYFSDFSNGKSPEAIQKERVEPALEEKQFLYYGIPLSVESGKTTINLLNACRLLKHVSVYKGPPERTFYSTQHYEITNAAPHAFSQLFGTNESISMFDYSTFIDHMVSYFSWSKEECENLLRFLSTNLDAAQMPGHWVNNPFILCKGKILWIGNLLKDRRWDNILLNKLKGESQFKKIINAISKQVEVNVIALFEKAGYTSFDIRPIKTSDGKSSDIDVMAYKDGHLIIGEVKCGSRSDEFSMARFYEMIRLEGTAAEQLAVAEQYVHENWDAIKETYAIPDERAIKDMHIHPIIITDYFEGDLGIYKDKYRKVSLLELDVILKNNKRKLLETYINLQAFTNGLNPAYNSEKQTVVYDLWEGILTPELLIKHIEEHAAWSGMEKIWKFGQQEYDLS